MRLRKMVPAFALAAVAALALAACDTDTTNKPADSSDTGNTAADSDSDAGDGTPKWHNQDGTYKVGDGDKEIPPGLYEAESAAGNYGMGGYYALCTDAACEPGEGMILNEIVPDGGSDFFEVTDETAYVELRGLIVTAD